MGGTGGATGGTGGATGGAGGATGGAGGATGGTGGATGGAGGATGGTGGATGGTGGATGGTAGVGGGTTCDSPPLDASGVFVAPDGDDTAAGSASAPVKTLVKAVSLLGTDRHTLYLASGAAFKEPLAIPAGLGTVKVHGGYAPGPAGWARTCGERARVDSPAIVGLNVQGGDLDEVHVTDLRVKSKSFATPAAGGTDAGTSIAVRVAGTLTVTLLRVEATAGTAQDGAAGEPGEPAAPSSACAPSCADGGAGDPGAPAAASEPGAFTAGGYTPGDGKTGDQATGGKDGTHGEDEKKVTGCTTKCWGCGQSECIADTTAVVTVKASTCGCGGPPGHPGSPGGGGGASVALFVSGAPSVTVKDSTLRSGRGGDGALGGKGSPGLEGTSGKRGDAIPYDEPPRADGTAECHQGDSCINTNPGNPNCGCYYKDTAPPGYNPIPKKTVQPNAPGGKGGKGGDGPDGGAGAGGPSVVVARSKGATVTLESDVVTTPGEAGKGAGTAPGGTVEALIEY